MSELSEKTRAEQEAGRRKLRALLQRSCAEEAVDKLVRRFPGAINTYDIDYVAAVDDFKVRLLVNCADGKYMSFDEMRADFPSDMMIAQIALVAR